jgi:hypothetical protein
MNTSTWILIIIGIINTILTTWFFLKIIMKLEKRLNQVERYILEDSKQNQVDVSDSVATGLVKGLQQMRADDEKHLQMLEMNRKLQSVPLGVMNQNSISKGFDTGGELIPGNLTAEEQEILRMYYDRTNER